MPKFHFIASSENGRITEGNEEARSTSDLLAQLASRGLRPVSIKQLRGDKAFSSPRQFFGGRITINDKIFLTKYLAIMLEVGIDLFQAINILLADFEKPALRALLTEIRDSLKRGQPLYSTFMKYPRAFSPVFINLVKSGEASGSLAKIFGNLNESLTKEKELRGKIRGALIYPILLLTLSIGILLFLTTFALPRLASVFTTGGFEPPAFSKAVFTVGLFISDYIWVLLGLGAAIIIGLWIFSKTTFGQRAMRMVLTRLPVVRKVVFRIAIEQMASTLSSLLKSGMPIIESLRITANTVTHPPVREALMRVADTGIAKGLSLGDSFRRESVFPFVVTNLVSISEKAGHLDEILETLSRFYEAEIESSIKAAVSFIEPVLLLFIGAVVATIALSIIVPVYQLVGQF